jgi:uncharacterized protein YhaN
MSTATVSLEGLAEHIANQQAELDALHKELESRQARMAKLNQRKEALEQRLRRLDAEIEAVSQGKMRKGRRSKARRAKPTAPASSTPPAPPKRMADMLVDIVREAKTPLTAKPLADELQKQGFYLTSPKLPRIVQARLNELVRDGVLRCAEDQPGVTMAKGPDRSKARTGRKRGRKKSAARRTSHRVTADGQPKVSLRSIVTEILAKSTRPMGAAELAEQAKARGWVTKSKDPKNVLWVMLGKMEDVENVSGEGYRLKKR